MILLFWGGIVVAIIWILGKLDALFSSKDERKENLPREVMMPVHFVKKSDDS